MDVLVLVMKLCRVVFICLPSFVNQVVFKRFLNFTFWYGSKGKGRLGEN